ncbi:MAG: NADH-quinone oxidoreductase subunit L [Chloroflexi bacterium]|nr:NADH-quinone oxidoreductase subunit L [Chloroflexota bacterium]
MEWAWIAAAAPLAAFPLVALRGKWLPGRGAYISIAAIGLSFVLFWLVGADFLRRQADHFSITWFNSGGTRLALGMIIDPLSVYMLGIVSVVALGVQVYSLKYMEHEPRFSWYFAVQSLFAASMLGLVLSDNFLLLYVTWELVGLCSYLLIGFWFEKRSAAEAAKKAFVTTRIGDVGLLIGILVLFKATGSFDIGTVIQAAESGQISSGTLTVAALLLFAGAMGKSAQFPLHVWLPDAMEGPTPVSALIHAATMVVAGVYLVARAFPIFEAAPGALEVVGWLGLLTALLTATMALVMTNLKQVLAYSTISHLGFMMLALGSIGFTGGMYHLMTHAFAKALLFLGAGSIAHGTGLTDIKDMGGLWRKMPLTSTLFILGALSLAGVPPLGGFFSKDEVLAAVYHNQGPVVLGLTLVLALLSALYMARLVFVVFFGPDRSRESGVHAHESPWQMVVPLVALAYLAVTSGAAAFYLPGTGEGLGQFLFWEEGEAFHPLWWLIIASMVIVAAGFVIAWGIYQRGWRVARALEPVARLARRKYYMDDLYQWTIDRVVLVFAGMVALFDRTVVNDGGVNGSGGIVARVGKRLRYHETGRVYNYGLVMAGAIVVLGLMVTLLR